MSTSLLYHGFGIRGYTYTRTAFDGGTIHFAFDQDKKPLSCSACGSSSVHPRGRTERTFRTLPIGSKPVVIHFEIPRVHCESCGLIRQVEIEFADERRSYTKAFDRYALELSRLMTIQDVAKHLNVGWDLIKDIVKRDLSKRFAKPKLKHLKQIAIDEISIGKGHKYLTLVLDLNSGAVVFVGEGKGADALLPFWKRLRGSHAKIKAVAMDMSPAYQEAVPKYLPKATIVFDHFHVIKLFNEKLSDLRRNLFHQAEDQEKKVLKGVRWLLLKNPENLDPAPKREAAFGRGLEIEQAARGRLLHEGGPQTALVASEQEHRPSDSSRTGLPGPRRPGSRCSSRSRRLCGSIKQESWPTTTSGSPRALWKGRTTRSRR